MNEKDDQVFSMFSKNTTNLSIYMSSTWYVHGDMITVFKSWSLQDVFWSFLFLFAGCFCLGK